MLLAAQGGVHVPGVVVAGDRGGVAHVHKGKVFVERRPDRIVGRDEHDGVAVGRRIDHRLRRQHAAGADPVLDDERRTEVLGQPFAHDAGNDVVRPAGREADHEAHGPVWEFLLRHRRRDDAGAEKSEQQDH